jgi:hypothetical protein
MRSICDAIRFGELRATGLGARGYGPGPRLAWILHRICNIRFDAPPPPHHHHHHRHQCPPPPPQTHARVRACARARTHTDAHTRARARCTHTPAHTPTTSRPLALVTVCNWQQSDSDSALPLAVPAVVCPSRTLGLAGQSGPPGPDARRLGTRPGRGHSCRRASGRLRGSHPGLVRKWGPRAPRRLGAEGCCS